MGYAVYPQGAGSGGATWTDYTPALTASTSNPTLGTASVTTGHYAESGTLVHVQVYIKFGTAGVNAGSGDYFVSLPVTAAALLVANFPVGVWWILDAGTKNTHGIVYLADTTKVGMRFTDTGSAGVDHGMPQAFAANDDLRLSFTYRSAA